MKCMKRVMSSLVALVMITNIAFGYTVTVSNGIYSIERTGMIDGKTVTVKANKTAGAEFEVKKGNITLNQAISGMPLADFTMPAEDVEIGIVTTPVNKPILGEGMVPVNWDKDAEDWVDTTEASWEWDYGNVASQESNGELDGYRVGKWANARTADGSMYVWIPRFSYKIISGEHQTVQSWNSDLIDGTEGTVGKIEIKFSQGAMDDLSDGFMNHPAFQFNGNEMSGFWVAKFEASRDDATEASEGVGTVPMSVPGVKSWTGASVGEAFTAAYELNQALGSHLIKNSEWGAVVFLTNAIGRTPYKNNHSEMLTGYSGAEQNAAVSGTASYWNEGTGVKASTTHNVYGVYDLAGAASEMTASYIVGSLTFEEVGSSVTAADDTYVDRYTGTTTGTAAEHFEALADITGDAMYETSAGGNGSDSAWDNGKSQMINESAHVLTRGSKLGDTASIFAFEGVAGAQDDVGFRVILLPAEAAATTGPNAPVLADGMIPLNWDGDNWVDTTEAEWEYNYDSVASVASNGSILGDGAGQWANARLADGSIYVWIPRYSYKISSGENKNVISWNSDSIVGDEEEVGRVKIRWSSGIHDFNSDGYIPHPAFNYAQYLGGDTSDPNNYNTSTTGGVTPLTDADKLEGFWVAKYEASRSDSIIAGEQRLLKVNTSTGITTYRYETSGDMIEITAAPMDGYEFIDWTISGATVSDSSSATVTFMMPNNDVTATANFRKLDSATVNVSFNSNGGSAISVKVVSVGNAYGELSIPAKAGYTFGGWYKEEALTNKVTSSTIVTTETDHTLYAKWGESTYTVSFDTDGGNAVANKTVTYNGTYGTLATPVKDGYIFDGWYKEAEFTNPVTSTTTVTATVDHTLYAKWLTAYTVTFNSNGGSAVDSIKVAYGKTYGTLPTPTRENYTFLGWYKEETFINQVTNTSTVTVESDHTLYANWQLNEVTVTLDQQGGSGGTTSVTATYGSAMPSITVPTKTNYRFLGYYTGTNGTGTQYYTSTGISIKNWDKTTATTLYAAWKSVIPTYTYTGTSSTSKDDTYWYIYLKSSGNLTFTDAQSIDIFLVGGGGGGYYAKDSRGGGGGGGYTATHKGIYAAKGSAYSIAVGAGGAVNCQGGTTSAFGKSVSGGYPGTHCDNDQTGGNGGSGGGAGADFRSSATYSGTAGASNGNSATSVSYGSPWNDYSYGGTGQGSTTRAFGTGELYAGGGGGGGKNSSSGGAGGGGTGSAEGVNAGDGAPNTGGGGGGCSYSSGGAGGSGIVIIRGALNPSIITLDNQGGTGAEFTNAFYGQTLSNVPVPTRTNYIFVGYYTQPNGQGTQYYTPGGEPTKTYDVNGDLTLYAFWYPLAYAYTGNYEMKADNTYWYIYLKSSGNLTFTDAQSIDIFLVGGGGGGYYAKDRRGGGGGGGYTATHTGIYAANGTTYPIVVGAGGAVNCQGGTTSAFGKSVSGGYPGTDCDNDNDKDGGDGGSGGGAGADFRSSCSYSGTAGASDGNSAESVSYGSPWNSYTYGGTGQGSTTRAFGAGELYAGGGGGGGKNSSAGGAGGGGTGSAEGVNAGAGAPNTGGGGGGCSYSAGGAGGSGVVIIRGLH
ncbi:MAG: InlB B-repeat-containing protein [Clostridia bacterium]|nr:InlB B-repeat-containing protein [Clostridia bacterium]